MAKRGSDLWWDRKPSQLPRSFAVLIKLHSDKMAMSLECSALIVYSAHIVGLIFTKRKRKYLHDHECTLLGFLPVRIAELRVKDGDLEVDERVL